MSQLLFQLGNTPELSIREITAVCGVEPAPLLPNVIVGFLNAEPLSSEVIAAEAKRLMQVLGGTVKIFSLIGKIEDQSAENLENSIASYLGEQGTGKVHFGIAELGRDHLPTLNAYAIKARIQELDRPARYVEGPRGGLSASVLTHQKNVREIAVLYTGTEHYLAETVAIQDIDEWTVRDRSKPYFDRKKGMLPPKLARIMVNLCFGTSTPSADPNTGTLLADPFCGSGTVLLEGLVRGTAVFGSDLDTDAVVGTLKNLEWLSREYNLSVPFSVARADAANVTPPQPVTHLVTEPFLGKPKPSPLHLPNIYKGLEKQYLGAFKHWRTFLADGAQLVVVFPLVELPGKTVKRFSLDTLIDKLATLGYTTSSEPVVYARPQAIVQRQIYHFTYTQ
jgi:tRNA G10  N-methylase Trm11